MNSNLCLLLPRGIVYFSRVISYENLLEESILTLKGITTELADFFNDNFLVKNIQQLASFAPYLEAKSLMLNKDDKFKEPPSAPSELIPEIIGSSSASINFSSIIREVDLNELELTQDYTRPPISPASTLFNFNSKGTLYLGYVAGHTQKWVNMGTHLGEIIHSIPLAPGESRNISLLDWKRRQQTQKEEDTTLRESLISSQIHKRALDEVTRAVAEEHQYGKTNTVSSNAVTSGSFVAAGSAVGGVAGGVTGGIIGGVTGGVTGLAVDTALLGMDLGAGTITGTVGGSIVGSAGGALVGSAVGAAAGGIIYSGATALGMIESSSEGDRNIIGKLQQNIMQRTSQKSSLIRSLWSTVVLEDVESENQKISTTNITNYNHMHAMTVQYYEVLQHYRAEISFTRATPVIFIPFTPMNFDFDQISFLWHYLENEIKKLLPNAEDIIDNAFTEIKEPDIPAEGLTLFHYATTKLKNITIKVTSRAQFGADLFAPDVHIKKHDGSYKGIVRDDDNPGNGVAVKDWGVERTDYYVKQFTNELKLNSIGHIKITENALFETTVTVKIEALIDDNGNEKDLYDEGSNLGTYTFPTTTAKNSKLFPWNPAQLLSDQQEPASNYETNRIQYLTELDKRNKARQQIIEIIRWKRFHFTQIILNQLDPEELYLVLDNLQVKWKGFKVNLNSIAHTIPIGANKNGVLLKLKYLPEQIYSTPQKLITKENNHIFPDFHNHYDYDKVNKNPLNGSELIKLIMYAKNIKDWSESNQEEFHVEEDLFLPTSGVFAEAILGKSNSAEKLDMTRFFNWQDSPIPNKAPEILPTDPNQDRHHEGNVDINIPEGTLNMVNPISYPMPTSLTETLRAVQNGNIFRDMSKSDQLVDIVSKLTQLSGELGKAASQMTGEAAIKAMQTAENVGETAADLSKSFLENNSSQGSSPGNMTEKGATLNEIQKMLDNVKDATSEGDQNSQYTNDGENLSTPEEIPPNNADEGVSRNDLEQAKLNSMGVGKNSQNSPFSETKSENNEVYNRTDAEPVIAEYTDAILIYFNTWDKHSRKAITEFYNYMTYEADEKVNPDYVGVIEKTIYAQGKELLISKLPIGIQDVSKILVGIFEEVYSESIRAENANNELQQSLSLEAYMTKIENTQEKFTEMIANGNISLKRKLMDYYLSLPLSGNQRMDFINDINMVLLDWDYNGLHWASPDLLELQLYEGFINHSFEISENFDWQLMPENPYKSGIIVIEWKVENTPIKADTATIVGPLAKQVARGLNKVFSTIDKDINKLKCNKWFIARGKNGDERFQRRAALISKHGRINTNFGITQYWNDPLNNCLPQVDSFKA